MNTVVEKDAYQAGERGGRTASRRDLGLGAGLSKNLASLDQKTKTCGEPGNPLYIYMVHEYEYYCLNISLTIKVVGEPSPQK